MAVLGSSHYGNTVLGMNEYAGKLGGVLTILDTEPIWMARHEGQQPITMTHTPVDTPILVSREEAAMPIILTREDGD